ncbi:MAG TPA: STAS domain-containing protein [Aquabacterium sp.]|nr:STAS domain-containing protein [Aquabacterium sp.]
MSDTRPFEPSFHLPAELTIAYAAQSRNGLLQAVSQGVSAFDARAVESIDTSGIQLLLALRRSLQAQQVSMRLLEPSDALQDALRLYGLSGLLTTSH